MALSKKEGSRLILGLLGTRNNKAVCAAVRSAPERNTHKVFLSWGDTLNRENIGVSGAWLFTWQDEAGNVLDAREEHNLITQSGLNALAALFIGELLQNNAVYLALGTGATAAASGNTKLQDEGFRKAITSKTRELNEVRLRFFLLTQEANGEWSEMAVMLAGTEIQDSGTMLNRILPPGGIRKASNQTLTVEVRIKFQGVS